LMSSSVECTKEKFKNPRFWACAIFLIDQAIFICRVVYNSCCSGHSQQLFSDLCSLICGHIEKDILPALVSIQPEEQFMIGFVQQWNSYQSCIDRLLPIFSYLVCITLSPILILL
jgi:hypothetical protein